MNSFRTGRNNELQVLVNVYDLHPFNQYVHWLGMGAYHTGVEVGGNEFSFGFLLSDQTGIFRCDPKHAPACAYRCTLNFGTTPLTHRQVLDLLEELKSKWPGRCYHMLTHNCVNFTDEFLFELTGRRLPPWTYRLTYFANYISCLLPASFRGPYPPGVVDEDADTAGVPVLTEQKQQPFAVPQLDGYDPDAAYPGKGRRLGSKNDRKKGSLLDDENGMLDDQDNETAAIL